MRTEIKPPRDNWQRCDICEWVFFRFIIPLLVAAALIGWYWSLSHAGQMRAYGFQVTLPPCVEANDSATVEDVNLVCDGFGKWIAIGTTGPAWNLAQEGQGTRLPNSNVTTIPRTQISPSATVEPDHYRCHVGDGDGDAIVFEPLDDKGQGLIVLHCVNCRCDEEK